MAKKGGSKKADGNAKKEIATGDLLPLAKEGRRISKWAKKDKALEEIGKKRFQPLVDAFGGTPKALLKALGKMKGTTTEASLDGILKAKDAKAEAEVEEVSEKIADATPAPAPVTPSPIATQSDMVEVEIVPPVLVACPKKTPDGRPVGLVAGADGSLACAAPKIAPPVQIPAEVPKA